ncbi:MAG TPA: hypothetical protein VHV10_04430 [Ktedonobacteraceae bacterium]|nr:hypothetical protein [Ktedonobacteraceae bacterium]
MHTFVVSGLLTLGATYKRHVIRIGMTNPVLRTRAFHELPVITPELGPFFHVVI